MSSQIISSNEFGQVQQFALNSAIDGLLIKHQTCDASVSLYGGQVLTWQPKGQEPVFWLSDTAKYVVGTAIRGGVPLCWPWFGPYHNGGNHGFARQITWTLTKTTINKNNITIELSLQGEKQHKLWPESYLLKQEIVFGEVFSQKLFMTNLSDKTVEYTGALHSYFCVSSPNNATIDQLSSIAFHDKLSGKYIKSQPLVNCVGPVDNVYHSNETMQIVDHQWQRIIEVSSLNCEQWVFWNPGVKGADSMPDIHKNGEQEFVCLEAANTNWQSIAANDTKMIGQSIRILKCK